MNKKQFLNVLEVWDEDFIYTSVPFEALTSFLKRLQRANQRKETDIKKLSDRKTSAARYITFHDNKSGVTFEIDVNYLTKTVNLIY